jgi:5-methyltetrahydropteroyltriglutamate--homocysteine methyltransferase
VLLTELEHTLLGLTGKTASRTAGPRSDSSSRILTTHVGSLPRPEKLIAVSHERGRGDETDDAPTDDELEAAVADVVRRQKEAGVDLINDGEYGHTMRYDYGSWWSYILGRLDGVVPPEQIFGHDSPIVRGPIMYTGYHVIQRDIANLKAALAAAGVEDGWMNSVAPASCVRFANQFYMTDEDLLYAYADAMREEYRAIIDAGLTLQLDDRAIAESWDQTRDEPTVGAYRRFTMPLIEALNHAIRDLPTERIRFHLYWGSSHGPHSTDPPMADVVEMMLRVNAKYYSFEAATVRHEHEWRVWEQVSLPDGKVILPGVVSHTTDVIEHPEIVADRIERFANLVGRENVIASTDCGLGGRVHPQVAWAKLESLSQGAALATKRLWRRYKES